MLGRQISLAATDTGKCPADKFGLDEFGMLAKSFLVEYYLARLLGDYCCFPSGNSFGAYTQVHLAAASR
jgi:hypothetical protein